ncbi:hypothetical protein VPNG_01686 [Cytospora leucostoma]|uniref:Uncharacterized protein n=1 Tax=Cytospora leucostoma TaxID=1230097 RepID=A0A423XK12_9PEZI|nr:hypothetical protein VPNG_01686 [Cytospora leucostoma]
MTNPFPTRLAALGNALLENTDPAEMAVANGVLEALFQSSDFSSQDRDNYARRFFGRRDYSQLHDDLTSASRPPTMNDRFQANISIDVLMLVKALNQASLAGGRDRGEQRTPLSLLQGMVATYFVFGPGPASSLFLELQEAVKQESYEITSSSHVAINLSGLNPMFDNTSYLWKSCKMAASLVLLLAAHPTPESMYEALKPQSRSMGGMPTLESIKSSNPDSLSKTFQEAKRAAIEEGTTTVMGVKLLDKHIFELVKRGTSEEFFSFAHTFTMGYINDEHAGLRSWDQAKEFVDGFEKLIRCKGNWSAKINKLYKKLFLVDINEICSVKGPERPFTWATNQLRNLT